MFIKIFNILLLLNSLETNTVDLPKARQVIIGQKGAGKKQKVLLKSVENQKKIFLSVHIYRVLLKK